MERYSEYKDSGVNWLGEIPRHWGLIKSKYLWKESFNISEQGNEELLSVSQYDGITPAKGDTRSEALDGYKIVKKDDLVINIMLAWMGGLGISAYNGIVSPAYCVYKLNHNYNPRFFHYLYKTPLYLSEFAKHSTGVIPSRWRMYTDDFGQVLSLIPPIEEQNAIVAYLDKVTSKIDAAIAQQQKMIELLNERKQIIINNAVTKGLDPTAKMKPSGIPWLGNIPAHWEVKKLKHLGTTTKNLINPKLFKEKKYSEYSMPAFDNGRMPAFVMGDNMESTKILLNGATLLVNKLNVHKRRIWFVNDPGPNSVASTEFIPFQLTHVHSQYVEYMLISDQITNYLRNNEFGATNSQRRISPNIIFNTNVTIPPIEEQIKIADYLKKQFMRIDMIIDKKKTILRLFKERKQIIINDIVTGKVKVI